MSRGALGIGCTASPQLPVGPAFDTRETLAASMDVIIQLLPRRKVVQHGAFAFRGDLSVEMRHHECAPRLKRIKLARSQIPAELSRHVAFVQRPQFRQYRS